MTVDLSKLTDEQLELVLQNPELLQKFLGSSDDDMDKSINDNQAESSETDFAEFPEDLTSLTDEQLLNLSNQMGIAPSERKLGVAESLGAGIAEGLTDPFVIGEAVSDYLQPERPESVPNPFEKEKELLDKGIENLSIGELMMLTDDDDIMPRGFVGVSKKEREEASPESSRPFASFQAQIPESKDELGRLVRRPARFATGALMMGGGAKGALELAKLGLAGQALREAGAGELVSTAVELGGAGLLKNIIKGRVKPKGAQSAIVNDLKKTAQRIDVQRLPAAALTENGAVQMVENLAQQSVFGQKAYRQLFNEIREGMTEKLSESLNEISTKRLSSLQQGGESLQQMVVKANNEAKNYGRAVYGFAEKKASGIEVPVQDLRRGLRRVSKKLGESFVKDGKEAGVKKLVDDFEQALANRAGKDGKVDLSRLIAQRRSIRSMINYQDIGGAKQFLKGVDNMLTKTFDRVGKNNQDWYRTFKSAEKEFSNQAKWFRNKLMRNVMFNESPEAIMNAINKPSDIAKLENALKVKGLNPQTKKKLGSLVDSIKRRKVEDIILDRVTGEDGLIKLSKLDVIPKNKKEFINSLLSKNGRQVVKDIDKIRKAVAEAGTKFANSSRSFSNAQDVGIIVTGLNAIFTGNKTLFAKTGIPAAAYWVASRTLTNPTITSTLPKLANAAKSGNAKKYRDLAQVVATEFNEILRQNNLTKEDVTPKNQS